MRIANDTNLRYVSKTIKEVGLLFKITSQLPVYFLPWHVFELSWAAISDLTAEASHQYSSNFWLPVSVKGK